MSNILNATGGDVMINPKIKEQIIKRYPHLSFIKDDKTFAQNATRLAAVPGVTPNDYYKLLKKILRR